MSKRFKEGEYMYLVWDGRPDAYYIRGHVEHAAGVDILIQAGAVDCEELRDELGQAEHIYGRWSMQGDAPEGCSCVLREYNTPGRGRFKITKYGVGIFAKKESEQCIK